MPTDTCSPLYTLRYSIFRTAPLGCAQHLPWQFLARSLTPFEIFSSLFCVSSSHSLLAFLKQINKHHRQRRRTAFIRLDKDMRFLMINCTTTLTLTLDKWTSRMAGMSRATKTNIIDLPPWPWLHVSIHYTHNVALNLNENNSGEERQRRRSGWTWKTFERN